MHCSNNTPEMFWTSRKNLKIIYADNNELVRLGTRLLLKTLALKVDIVEVLSFQQLIGLSTQQLPVDLIIFDYALDDANKDQSIRYLRGVFPGVPVVVFTALEDRDLIMSTMQEGASGFVLKNSSAKVITKAFGLILCGEVFFPKSMVSLLPFVPAISESTKAAGRLSEDASKSHQLLDTTPRSMHIKYHHCMTPRQIEVLSLLATGLSNKEIARELDLSPGTVKNYVADVLRILGISNRLRAICKILSAPPGEGRL